MRNHANAGNSPRVVSLHCPLERLAHAALVAAALLASSLWPRAEARAADTVETFDPGLSNLELYLVYDGLTRSRRKRSLGLEWVAGYGIVPAFSVYVGARMQTVFAPVDLGGELMLGVLATPLDTRHFDLDLGLDLSGPEPAQLSAAPNIELNFDAEDQLARWGTYARASLPVHGGGRLAGSRPTVAVDLELTFGAYSSVARGHQILLEHRLVVPAMSTPGSGLALGYNVVCSEVFELLTEASVTFVDGYRLPDVAVLVGFVATVPGAAPRRRRRARAATTDGSRARGPKAR